MADEFVDFYEALNLSPEAERKEVHRRISDLYLEAQRNLDHRDFQTRVKYQEMFEVVLPRARYILLDAARREDYDHLVRAFRGVEAPVPQAPPEPVFGAGDASSFRLAEDVNTNRPAGRAPRVEALPKPALNAAQMAAQRDEMWAKWKSGLESAIALDETEPQPQPTKPTPRPTSTQLVEPQVEAVAEMPAPRQPRQQASSISFNFNENALNSGDDEESARATAFEIERQKTERKRAVMKEILDSVGLKGTLLGGIGTAIPLGALLITGMGHYYPRGAAPHPSLPPLLAWFTGIALVIAAALFAATEMSKSLRRQASMELSMLPVEELLRKVGRSY